MGNSLNNLVAAERSVINRPVLSHGTTGNLSIHVKANLEILQRVFRKALFYETKKDTDKTGEVKDPERFPRFHKTSPANLYQMTYKEDGKPVTIDLAKLLQKDLTPKKSASAFDKWDDLSLIDILDKGDTKVGKYTLNDIIDRESEISKLRADLYHSSKNRINTISNKSFRTIAQYDEVLQYLLIYGFLEADIDEINGFMHFLQVNTMGLKSFQEYINVSAARDYIASQKLQIDGITFNEPTGKEIPLIKEIRTAELPYLMKSFENSIDKSVEKHVHAEREHQIIEHVIAKTGLSISPEANTVALNFLKSNPMITEEQAVYLLPSLITHTQGTPTQLTQTYSDEEAGLFDYSVKNYKETAETLDINRSNIYCAAQLFYVMTLGDELGIFDAVNYLTSHYITSGRIEIQNKQLLADLQLYVFSEQFRNLRDNKSYQRTEPPQRYQFYKQVFNYGNIEVGEGFVVNENYQYAMEAVARTVYNYLQMIADGNVSQISTQNIAQAVEDLQYNLSSCCTGMVKVVSPFINAELDFVIERILNHPEIISQLAPVRGSFWTVLEKILTQLRKTVPNRNAILDKAQYGNEIIKFVADYNSDTFNDPDKFNYFISLVEAYALAETEINNRETMQSPSAAGDIPESDDYATSPVEKMHENGWNF